MNKQIEILNDLHDFYYEKYDEYWNLAVYELENGNKEKAEEYKTIRNKYRYIGDKIHFLIKEIEELEGDKDE